MREIKFRGKRVDNGEWAVGCLIRFSEEQSVIVVDVAKGEVQWVLAETVGQYTGLKDKNGKEIYEGDIIAVNQFGGIIFKGKVVFEAYRYNLDGFYFSHYEYPSEAFSEGTNNFEVIGNIHDNPKLVEWQYPRRGGNNSEKEV